MSFDMRDLPLVSHVMSNAEWLSPVVLEWNVFKYMHPSNSIIGLLCIISKNIETHLIMVPN